MSPHGLQHNQLFTASVYEFRHVIKPSEPPKSFSGYIFSAIEGSFVQSLCNHYKDWSFPVHWSNKWQKHRSRGTSGKTQPLYPAVEFQVSSLAWDLGKAAYTPSAEESGRQSPECLRQHGKQGKFSTRIYYSCFDPLREHCWQVSLEGNQDRERAKAQEPQSPLDGNHGAK